MMRKKWCLVCAALLGISVGAVNPIANQYVAPIVQKQLHTSLNGSVQYDSLSVGWNGDVHLQNLVIRDSDEHLVATVPNASVSLNLSSIPSIVWGNTSGGGIIGTVDLDAPNVHIWQMPDGTWNVTTLIKSSQDSSKKSFNGDVIVHNGTAKLQWQNGNTHAITNLDGVLSIDVDTISKGAISGALDNQSFNANGSIDMNKKDDFDIFVSANQLNVAPFIELLPVNKNVTFSTGILKDARIQVTSRDGIYSLAGSVQFEDVAGNVLYGNKKVSLANGNGRVFLQDKHILISRSAFLVNNQTVKTNGLVDIESEDVGLNLNVVVDSADIGAFTEQMITGTVGGRAHIGGTSVNPLVIASVKSSGLGYNGYFIDNAEADVMYTDGVVTLKQGTAFIGDGHIKGEGRYRIDSSDFDVSMTMHNVNVAAASAGLPEPMAGILNGSVKAVGKNNTVTALQGSIVADTVSVRGVTIDTVQGTFDYDGNATNVALNGAVGTGTFSGYGTLLDSDLDLSVSGNLLDVSNFKNLVGADIDGYINATATITGAIDNQNIVGSIASGELHYGGAHFNSINADFEVANRVLAINNGRISDGNGNYAMDGTFGLDTKSLELELNATATRIENLIRPFTDVPITGWFETHNKITGTVENPRIVGESHLYDGSLYGKLISDARASYTVDNQELRLSSISIKGYGATITGSGTASRDKLDIDFVGDDIDVKRLLINTDYDVDGYVSAKGRIQGNVNDPRFYGVINSKALTINGETISNLFGMLYIDSAVINSENLSFDEENGGHYKAKGGMSLVGDHRLFGSLDVQGGRVNNLLELLGKSVPNLDGSLNGAMDIAGTRDNPSVHVVGTVKDVTIDKQVVGDAEVDAGLENRKITVKTMKLPVGDGIIAAGGSMDLDGDSDIQVALRNVDVKQFIPLIGKDINATGSVTGVVNMTGKTQNPKIELSASLVDGSFNGVSIDQAFMLATMENRVINIQRIQGDKGVYKLSAYGKIPLAAIYTSGYLDANDSKAMDMTIDFNDADMAVLPLMLSSVKDATGQLKGLVHITGTIDQPEAYGTVSIRNGMISIDKIGNPINNIDADLIFSGQQGDFQSRFIMGKGTAGLAAKVNWEGHIMTNYRMAAQLEGIDLANEYVSGPLKGELYIADRDGIPTLMGHIDLEDMKLKIPLSYESSESTKNLGMDVTVHAGKNVRLYDRTLYDMTIGGDVHFGGSVFYPEARGQFNVDNGTFKYLSHTFAITKGTANFVNGSYLPRLQLDAETTTNNYTIMIGVNGTVDQMNLTLKSDPQLSRKQIISMLTFGRGTSTNSSSISNEDANAIAVAGVQMFAFGYVQDALQNTLGLDRVNITTGSIDPDEPTNHDTAGHYNIEIGKYILPRTMITYTQGINNSQTKYGVEYSVKRNLKLTSWHTSKGNTYLGGRWTREF